MLLFQGQLVSSSMGKEEDSRVSLMYFNEQTRMKTSMLTEVGVFVGCIFIELTLLLVEEINNLNEKK